MIHQSKVYTFWMLLSNFSITVPIIQRDYAQGRKGKEVEHVRNEFLRVLFDVLQTGRPIELDFIYGTVNKAKQFAPLDGQQRLTTLFLLHWYIALKEGELDANQSIFQKFTYETRLSSKQFCRMLTTLTDLDLSETTLSKQIYNEANFYYGWAHDPTVDSMLIMIDTIHAFANKYNLPVGLFETLTNNAPITFQFIDLDSFQLEDTLYIKMNARGKPLTPFENFKARFQQYLDDIENIKSYEISHKIDTDWSDFFWKHHKTSYDESFLQFIIAILYNQLARNNQNRDRLFLAINKGEPVRVNDLANIPFDAESWIRDIEITLDFMCNGILFNQLTVIDIQHIINEAMTDNMNYTERVQFYAIVSYIRTFGGNFEAFERWLRFIRNVTVNTIYNRVEDFIQSIQEIDLLVIHAQELNEFITDPKTKLTGFFGAQLTQEQLKAQLVLYDETWKEPLYKAEDHGYFEGEIGFLLHFIDADDYSKWSKQTHLEKQTIFKSYYEKAACIFGKAKLNVPINLLSRALLTFGDYLIQSGQNRSFLIEGFDRDISWKRFLRHSNSRYLKLLLDEVKPESLVEDLQRIIDESSVADWRKHFIQYSAILEKRCGIKRLIRYYDDKDILLLDTTMTSGYCQEYYSYAVYAALCQKGVGCRYYDSVGAFNEKYVQLDDESFSLNYVNKQFYIYNESDEVIAEPQNFEEAVEKMTELSGVNIGQTGPTT